MGKTTRRGSPHINLGEHLGHKKYWNGKVRDGTPTHYSGGCEHHGGCPYCEGNRLHGNKRREPLEVDDVDYD